MPSRIISGIGSRGGAAPGPGPSGALPYIMVPFQSTSIQVIASQQYVEWTNTDTQRPPTISAGATLIPGSSANPTVIFSIPPSPGFTAVNIELVIEPILYNSAIPWALFQVRKNGSALAYENMPIVSKRILSDGNNSSGEIFNLINVPVAGSEDFSLYAVPNSGSIQFRASSAISSNATNLMYCRVEEVQ